jgi:hypothetical protein
MEEGLVKHMEEGPMRPVKDGGRPCETETKFEKNKSTTI